MQQENLYISAVMKLHNLLPHLQALHIQVLSQNLKDHVHLLKRRKETAARDILRIALLKPTQDEEK